jgi:drug/metabolite transporter (DMT)-like permease
MVFSLSFSNHQLLIAVGAAAFMGIMGTAFAIILFYTLVKRAGGIFASMVTYGIPFVAITWGYIFGESIGMMKIASLLIILLGVYWANRNPSALKH